MTCLCGDCSKCGYSESARLQRERRSLSVAEHWRRMATDKVYARKIKAVAVAAEKTRKRLERERLQKEIAKLRAQLKGLK